MTVKYLFTIQKVNSYIERKTIFMTPLDRLLTRKILSTFPLVVSEIEVHHFDRYPILFSGLNGFGGRVLGSFIEETEDQSLRFFHNLITPENYLKFLAREISYRQILEETDSLFVVQTKMPLDGGEIWEINVKDLPRDYLPADDSYL